jgi:hypothetical protein
VTTASTGVQAGGGDPVHVLDAVVHGVEAPQPRYPVAEAMAPVATDHHDRGGEPDRRPTRQDALEVESTQRHERDGDHDHGHDGRQRHEQPGHEEVGEVGHEPGPSYRLAAKGDGSLERDEHERHHRQADDRASPHHESHGEGQHERHHRGAPRTASAVALWRSRPGLGPPRGRDRRSVERRSHGRDRSKLKGR